MHEGWPTAGLDSRKPPPPQVACGGVHDGQRESRGHGRIHGAATLPEHLGARFRG